MVFARIVGVKTRWFEHYSWGTSCYLHIKKRFWTWYENEIFYWKKQNENDSKLKNKNVVSLWTTTQQEPRKVNVLKTFLVNIKRFGLLSKQFWTFTHKCRNICNFLFYNGKKLAKWIRQKRSFNNKTFEPNGIESLQKLTIL